MFRACVTPPMSQTVGKSNYKLNRAWLSHEQHHRWAVTVVIAGPEYPLCSSTVDSVLVSKPEPVPDALKMLLDMSEPSC